MRRMIAAALLAMVLTGCAVPSEQADASAEFAPVIQARTAQAEGMSSSMVESSARPLLEEEILEAYDRAVWVYGWFDLTPLPVSEESRSIDGQDYDRVDMEGMEDLEDLRAYLRGVFSKDLTDRLLDGKSARIQYREVEGALYALGSGRERNAYVGAAYVETEQFGETEYEVNVLVELLDEDGETVAGLESWSFPYVFEDDRWVFTDFRLVY